MLFFIKYLVLLHFVIMCTGKTITDMRLAKGPDPFRGRLEVKYGRLWGTVCDDGFDDKAAIVSCRQMGYKSGIMLSYAGHGQSYVPEGNGIIWLDDLKCEGTERTLDNCRTKDWGKHNCIHYEDVVVQCYPTLRLLGNDGMSGLLQIRFGTTWGAICKASNHYSAIVACKELGFVSGMQVKQLATDFPSQDVIWFGNVTCSGEEQSLIDCPRSNWRDAPCSDTEKMIIECFNGSTDYELRLYGGHDQLTGRLEVKYAGVWGTVCSNATDNGNANVACREMGFSSGEYLTNYIHEFQQKKWQWALDNLMIWLNLACEGTESTITECRSRWGIHDCDHSHNIVMRCRNGSSTSLDYELRIRKDSRPFYGKLEVRYAGLWRPFCGNTFDDTAGPVVCRELGKRYGGVRRNNAQILKYYRQQLNYPVWLVNISCKGGESGLGDCGKSDWGEHECNEPPVEVWCTDKMFKLRLVDGPDKTSGFLQVKFGRQWGTVCSDKFTKQEVGLVCRDMGYYLGDRMSPESYYYRQKRSCVSSNNCATAYSSFVYFHNGCKGGEETLTACTGYVAVNKICKFSQYIGVSCWKKEYRLRLSDTPSKGRLEVQYRGIWGTVDRHSFPETTAPVICRELGFLHGYFRQWNMKSLHTRCNNIWQMGVVCEGHESNLAQCKVRWWIKEQGKWGVHFVPCGERGCFHNGDVHIECVNNDYTKYEIRLTGKNVSENLHTGQLEINFQGICGRFCNEGFSNASASVACKELGYSTGEKLPEGIISNDNTHCSSHILIDQVDCVGNETTLNECTHNAWRLCNCSYCVPVTIRCWNVLRLVGPQPSSGRLEIKYQGEWGTVCQHSNMMYNQITAHVACKELGYTTGIFSDDDWNDYLWEHYLFYSDDLYAFGSEYSTELPGSGYSDISGNTLDYSADILDSTHGSADISSSDYSTYFEEEYNQPVDYSSNDISGSFESEQWDYSGFDQSASGGYENQPIECSAEDHEGSDIVEARYSDYDYSDYINHLISLYHHNYRPIWLAGIECEGQESSLAECRRNPWGQFDSDTSLRTDSFNNPQVDSYVSSRCRHHEDVYIRCSNKDAIELRLTGGDNSTYGYLEIKYNNQWGSVLMTYGNQDIAANIACRDLGFVGGGHALEFPDDQKPEGLQQKYTIDCIGFEASLRYCRFVAGQRSPLIIKCYSEETKIRLSEGVDQYSGYLEMKSAGSWYKVCYSNGYFIGSVWDVACRQLGFENGINFPKVIPSFEHADWQSLVQILKCYGHEASLQECKTIYSRLNETCPNIYNMHYSRSYKQYVYMRCWSNAIEGMRLYVGGENDTGIGRLEVRYQGEWGTVCDDLFTHNQHAAIVACTEMGYKSGWFVARVGLWEDNRMSPVSDSKMTIWLDDVRCNGTEKSLSECSHAGWGQHNCDHSEDVVIQCIN